MNLKLPTHLVFPLKMLYVSLDIKANKHSPEDHLKNPVEIAIKIFYQHPYILLPKILLTIKNYFSIAHHENILKEIINLDNKKMELLKTLLLAVWSMYQIYVALF